MASTTAEAARIPAAASPARPAMASDDFAGSALLSEGADVEKIRDAVSFELFMIGTQQTEET
jgi:hypothetical protein